MVQQTQVVFSTYQPLHSRIRLGRRSPLSIFKIEYSYLYNVGLGFLLTQLQTKVKVIIEIMDPAAPVIRVITNQIDTQMKQVSDGLYKKYSAVLERIEAKRFNTFKQCLKATSDIADCYQKTDKYEVNIDFHKASKEFQLCVQSVTNDCMDEKIKKDDNYTHKRISLCSTKYQNFIVSEMQREIKRLHKLF